MPELAQGSQVFRRNLDHSDIGVGVAADQFCRQRAAVVDRDRNIVGAFDHMVVGEHITLGRVDDDARTQRLLDALARRVLQTEELAKDRILH